MTEDIRDLIKPNESMLKDEHDYTGPTSQKPIPVTRDHPTPAMPQLCASCARVIDGSRFPVYVEYDTSDGVHHRHGYSPVFGI